MRYYCPKCKSEYNTPNFEVNWCFICKHSPTVTVPDFETPEQYEKRTGKTLSLESAVWYITEDGDENTDWLLDNYGYAKGVEGVYIILCANSPEPPPDGYVLEVE